ncbi:MAG: alpha/beta fold hydrolase [Planctomycetes bacterium]|nr:alpha/beta fold hydrolase [Planctomycetota bacterium]
MKHSLILAALLAATLPSHAEEVEFKASDGVALSGTLTLTDAKAPTVLCLPMYRSERSAYAPLVKELTAKGLNVFAIDLRGHGKSSPELAEKVEARDPALFNAMHLDVAAALEVLEAKGLDLTRVAVVGASVGCSVAIDASTRHPKAFKAMVLLTPGANYLGVDSLAHAKTWQGLPTWIVTSEEEADGARPVFEALDAKSDEVMFQVVKNRTGIHGTRAFGKVPGLEPKLATWLRNMLER